MNQPLFMKPVLQEKIWGGTKLRDDYGYDIPSDHTGECWAISAHPDGTTVVRNGPYKGMPLSELYQSHPQLFGNPTTPVFPLLTKIIDATEWLSVQVHPGDEYALEHEGEFGKTECWYILDADPDSAIIFGHNATTKEEFEQLVKDGEWNKLFREVPVMKGDFFMVPSGTIHAIGAGITLLETQQSSNTTYRVYDFDRLQDNGEPRELHLKQVADVTMIPHVDPVEKRTQTTAGQNHFTTLVQSDYFTVYHWQIEEPATFKRRAPYQLVSVIDGNGSITVEETTYSLQKGDHFLLPHSILEWSVDGSLELIASTPGPKNS